MRATNAPYRAFLKTSTALTAAALLAACGGGGSGGGGPDFVDLGATPVLATGGADNFSGSTATFPWYIIDADDGIVRGVTTIRRVNGDTLEITGESGELFELRRLTGVGDSGTFELYTSGGSATGFVFTLGDRGNGYYSLFLSDDTFDPDQFALSGGFGYETETMPTGNGVFYDASDFARILVIEDGETEFTSLVGNVDLTVNFDSATVTGSVFRGTNTIDLDESGGENDDLFIDIEMDGEIVGNKIGGTVSANSASVDLNDSGVDTPLTLTLTNTDVDGQFFGDNAEWINGTWGADLTLTDGSDSLSGEAVGFFEVQVD